MADQPTERLEVGSIGKAHGLRGEVQVRLTTDRTERLDPGSELHTDGRTLVVGSSRPHQNGWLVRFEGVDDRNAAEELRGAALSADPIEDPDALWVHELIGATLVETDGTERGTVESVQANPASDLLVTDSGALVPLTFVVEFSQGVVTINVPAGLFDLAEDGD
ncbi:MAG: ribosome maturation factor RimM [Actinomycetota bacterium]